MFRLGREVRFAINSASDQQLNGKPTNSYAGFPSLTGLGHFFALEVALAGELDERSRYVRNIKEIDQVIRQRAIPQIETEIRQGRFRGGCQIMQQLFSTLRDPWPGSSLQSLRLQLSPFSALSIFATEFPMVRLSQKFEFSATHRLHNPKFSEEENSRTFGKCNNPHGHGHNYELEVTLAGKPDERGVLIDIPAFERLVATTVIDRFDHKNLNVELPEFRELIPTVENIAMTIYRLLKPKLADAPGKLAAVTVWETPKTWCEYSE